MGTISWENLKGVIIAEDNNNILIIAEHFSKLMKDTKPQIWVAQRTPSRINTPNSTSTHNIHQLQNTKDKKQSWKKPEEKEHLTYAKEKGIEGQEKEVHQTSLKKAFKQKTSEMKYLKCFKKENKSLILNSLSSEIVLQK